MNSRFLKGALVGGLAGAACAAATVALAGSGVGAVFNLGRTNTVDAQSKLVGNTGNAELKVQNTGAGRGTSAIAGAGRGLDAASTANDAVRGEATTGVGVAGYSNGGSGVSGESTKNDGVLGVGSTGYAGVNGFDDGGGTGVQGTATGSATGIEAESDSGAGVVGISSGQQGVDAFSSKGPGISGDSKQAEGVVGITQGATNSGVAGEADHGGTGVSGTGGIGVVGYPVQGLPGWSFKAEGHATQSRTGGGFVKAMAVINPHNPNDPITRCFNSQLPPGQASAFDCGITVAGHNLGVWILDFGFKVSDRFVSVTPFADKGDIGAELLSPGNANQWEVETFYASVNDHKRSAVKTDSRFAIVVY